MLFLLALLQLCTARNVPPLPVRPVTAALQPTFPPESNKPKFWEQGNMITTVIYDGKTAGFENGFETYSYGYVKYNNTEHLRPGSKYCIKTNTEYSTGLVPHGPFTISFSGLKEFSFYIYSEDEGVATSIQLTRGDGKVLGKRVDAPKIPQGKWFQVKIPFSNFNDGSISPDQQIFAALLTTFLVNGGQHYVWYDNIQYTGTVPPATPVTVTVTEKSSAQVFTKTLLGSAFQKSAQLHSGLYTLNRWGGNAETRYAWDLDVNNHAADWYFENIANPMQDPKLLPNNSTSDHFLMNTIDANQKALLTVPMIGWGPFDRQRRCGFSINKYGKQQKKDPYYGHCGNGVYPNDTDIVGNDPHDTSVERTPEYVLKWMQHIHTVLKNNATQVNYLQLDNEPGLWSGTHRDVHPIKLSYNELWNKTSWYAAALKEAYPNVKLFGPMNWGYCTYYFSPLDNCKAGGDRKAHMDYPLLKWYLYKIGEYHQTRGVQLVDFVDIHFYPQESNVAFSADEDVLTVIRRMRSTRGFWDYHYNDQSWISKPIAILPELQGWIKQFAPWVSISVSEYNWGGDNTISGAVANVEVISILGRFGVTVGSRWTAPAANSKASLAFKMFNNYDGQGGKVSGTAMALNTTNVDTITAWGFGGKYFIVICKHPSAQIPVTLDFGVQGEAHMYTLDRSHDVVNTGSVSNFPAKVNLPPISATLFVVE